MKTEAYVIFQNDEFVALNKPAGLLTIPDREGKEISLKEILKEKFGEIFTVHRLDKETTGVVVFAKNEKTHRQLSFLFEGREVEKIYLGLVLGKPLDTTGNIDAPIMEHPLKKGIMTINKKASANRSSGRGKPSSTDYQVLEVFRFYSWMQFQIHTGRTHQIRIHMKHAGNPIVCDPVYGDGKPVMISSIKKELQTFHRRRRTSNPVKAGLTFMETKFHTEQKAIQPGGSIT